MILLLCLTLYWSGRVGVESVSALWFLKKNLISEFILGHYLKNEMRGLGILLCAGTRIITIHADLSQVSRDRSVGRRRWPRAGPGRPLLRPDSAAAGRGRGRRPGRRRVLCPKPGPTP